MLCRLADAHVLWIGVFGCTPIYAWACCCRTQGPSSMVTPRNCCLILVALHSWVGQSQLDFPTIGFVGSREDRKKKGQGISRGFSAQFVLGVS